MRVFSGWTIKGIRDKIHLLQAAACDGQTNTVNYGSPGTGTEAKLLAPAQSIQHKEIPIRKRKCWKKDASKNSTPLTINPVKVLIFSIDRFVRNEFYSVNQYNQNAQKINLKQWLQCLIDPQYYTLLWLVQLIKLTKFLLK